MLHGIRIQNLNDLILSESELLYIYCQYFLLLRIYLGENLFRLPMYSIEDITFWSYQLLFNWIHFKSWPAQDPMHFCFDGKDIAMTNHKAGSLATWHSKRFGVLTYFLRLRLISTRPLISLIWCNGSGK